MSHEHAVIDSDKYYIIDPIMRTITNTGSLKTKLMQKDHNSERFTFEMPKEIEGHDMNQCNSIQVHFANTDRTKKNKSTGYYTVNDLTAKTDDDTKLIFTWTIQSPATVYDGSLTFFINFRCIDENGVITYRWSTDINTDVSIGKCDDSASEFTEEEIDELEAWKNAALQRVELLEETAHTHRNAKTLDGFWCNSLETGFTQDVSSEFLFWNGQAIAFMGGGATIIKIDEDATNDAGQKVFRIWLHWDDKFGGRTYYFDIPVADVKKTEAENNSGVGSDLVLNGSELVLSGSDTDDTSTIPIVTALPETAKFGDICKYARANNLSTDDAGKTIYFDNDWINQVGATYENATDLHWYMTCNSGNFDISITSNGLSTESKLRVDITSRDYGCTLYYQADNDGKLSLITDGSVNNYYVDSNGRVTITEMPKSLPIPDDVYTNAINDTAPFIFFRHTPKLMIYLDKWVEFPDIPTKTSELENDSSFVTKNELDSAIAEVQGGVDEIEALIDDSGVLGE